MKLPFLPTGGLFISSSLGGSVASASAPSVSIIIFTHRSWTAVSGALPESSETHFFERTCVRDIYVLRVWKEQPLFTSSASGVEVDRQCNDVNSKLKLHKLLNVYVD